MTPTALVPRLRRRPRLLSLATRLPTDLLIGPALVVTQLVRAELRARRGANPLQR